MHNYAPTPPHLIEIAQLGTGSFHDLMELSRQIRWTSFRQPVLAGKTVVLIFEKPSLRTRVTFEVAVRRLGAWPVLLGDKESRLGDRESLADMARNLSLWVDCIVARVYSHRALAEFASHSTVPVVNALSDFEHPCQALADLVTLYDAWDTFEGRTLAYVGDWNNVSRSLWRAANLAGLTFRAVCPKGYGPGPDENVDWTSDIDGVSGADAIYTDAWASMGQEHELEERQAAFAPYQVNEGLLALTGKPSLFMHCLPAHRGIEVTDSVIDSERSLVFQQAENRLFAEMAILISLLEQKHEAAHQEGRPGLFRRPGYINHHSMAQGKLWL